MKKIFLTIICFYFLNNIVAQISLVNPKTDTALLKDFQNRKLGLFIHWMACHSPETGDSWAIGRSTSKHIADSITLGWNPENFNPKEIIDFAVKSGSKYIVVISKHHDGFAIWDSKFSNWDIEKSKFKRDILKELQIEAHKQGLLFGIYYSIADIHYSNFDSMPEAGNVPPMPQGGKDKFINYVHNQVKELITNYQPDILWFDGHWLDPIWGPKEGKDLYNFIKDLKPSILTTRLAVTRESGNPTSPETFVTDGSAGDFFSYEAKTNDGPAFPWEACTSVSYPVYAYEPNAKMHTKEELINTFSKVLCGNGNLLLNIGPTPKGELPKQLTDRFLQLSSWIDQNKEAVYYTKGGPFKQGKWGGSTYKENKIYLHIREPLSKINLSSLSNYKIISVKDIATGKNLKITKSKFLVHPIWHKEEIISVIEIVLDKPFIFTDWLDLTI